MMLSVWILLLSILLGPGKKEWGFYAHRKINRYAVYTLPDPLYDFFKTHQGYLEYHAVDADKRRYAVKKEAQFHYLDMDVFNEKSQIYRDLEQMRWKFGHVSSWLNGMVTGSKRPGEENFNVPYADTIYNEFLPLFGELVIEDSLIIELTIDTSDVMVIWKDSFSDHGLLPYRINQLAKSLEYAFVSKDLNAILRLSADLGHYIGDAHVPLHTTSNYNGQLTGQHGVHAFWESRLPELFLHKKHCLAIRPANFFHSVPDSVWMLMQATHSLVNKVLDCEKNVRLSLSEDQINCYESRSGRYDWMPCPEFADAFDQCLENMVWEQWEAAIQFLGSIWYTAWANAGQPDLSDLHNDLPDKVKVHESVVNNDRECNASR